jgi:hypothetical protein
MSAEIISFPAPLRDIDVAAGAAPPMRIAPDDPSIHGCHADDCKEEIPRHMAFCAGHGSLLSAEDKQRIWRAYRVTTDHGHEYVCAVDNAVEHLRRLT